MIKVNSSIREILKKMNLLIGKNEISNVNYENISYKIVNEYRAWKSHDETILETDDMDKALDKFNQHCDCSPMMDGPGIKLKVFYKDRIIRCYSIISNKKQIVSDIRRFRNGG